MINFAIQPINFLDAVLTQSWFPPQWATMQREINPWNDPFVDRLNLIIFNLKRQIRLRSPELRDYALHRLGHRQEWIIESEFEFYLDSLNKHLNILRAYLWDHYLQADIDSFMAIKKPMPIKEVIDADHPPLAYGQFSILNQILSDSIGYAELRDMKEEARLPATRYDLTSEPALSIRIKQSLNSWEICGPRNHLTNASMNHLLYEFACASGDHNMLSGPAAKQRMLFINEAIPLPNRHTFFAWWHLCGLSAVQLTEDQRKAAHYITGTDSTYFLCFNLPSLPMTQEHVSGSPNPGEDSQTDHSLPGRSSAHDRTVHGRIIHGRWESYSFLVDVTSSDESERVIPTATIDSLRFGGRSGKSLIHQHWSIWPFIKKHWQSEAIFDRRGDSCVYDPYLAFMYPLNVNFHTLGTYEFDSGMRSLSKWHHVNLRFSDNPLGALAAVEWRNAFIESFIWWINATDNDKIIANFESALIRQERRTVSNTATAKRGRPKKADPFNFAAIFGVDSDD